MKQKEYIAECRDEQGRFTVIRAYDSSLKNFNSNIRGNGYTIRFSCTIGNYATTAYHYYNRKEYCRKDEFEGMYQPLPHYSNYVIHNSVYRNQPEFAVTESSQSERKIL